MDALREHSGVAAPLMRVNIDTDMIIPKQHLKTIQRTGLGRVLFDELRYDEDGRENPEFILNQDGFRSASVLIVGRNFGCGSSREHAPWALKDFGIKVIIAPSFADIFYNNCFQNGMLPIVMDEDVVSRFAQIAEFVQGAPFSIDLVRQTARPPNGEAVPFEIDPYRKHCLVNGLDNIGLTLEKDGMISAYEAEKSLHQSWI